MLGKSMIAMTTLLGFLLAATCLYAEPAAGLSLVPADQEKQVAPNESLDLSFELADSGRVVLAFNVRGVSEKAGGFADALVLEVNGQVIDGSRAPLNKPATFELRSGSADKPNRMMDWFRGGTWMVPISPDYTAIDKHWQYGIPGVQACRFEFDITDLARVGTNSVRFTRRYRSWSQVPVAVADVSIRREPGQGLTQAAAKPAAPSEAAPAAPAASEAVTDVEVLERRTITEEQRIEPGTTWQAELPELSAKGARLLRVTIRREAERLGGYGAYLHLTLNGEPVDAARSRRVLRLMNKPASFTWPSGRQAFWNQGDGVWLTIFAPNYTTDFTRYGPGVDEPYTYLLDVSDLVKPGGANVVAMSNLYSPAQTGADLSLVATLEWIAAKPPAGQAAALVRPTISARPELRITSDGVLELATEDEPIRIESTFSVPHGGQNAFGEPSREATWKPTVTQVSSNRWKIEAEGAYYRLVREIEQTDGQIAVRDTFHNLASEDVGIIFSNHLSLANQPAIDYARIGGRRGQGLNEVNNRRNPTLFFPLKDSSLTLIAEDDVYRNHATFYYDTEAQRSGMRDEMFAMAPGTAYTVEWSIYTTPSEDYYDMINRVRRDWGANHTLVGPVYFANYRQVLSASEEQLKAWVDKLGAQYIAFWEVRASDPQPRWDNRSVFAYGPGLWDPIFDEERKLVKQAVDKLHALDRDLKVTLYTHSFYISPEHPDDRTFEDSWIITADGSRAISIYNNDKSYNYRTVYPTLENSYGEAFMKVMDFYLEDLGLDWLYWDESNGPGVTVTQGDSLEAYLTYNAWDGHTAKIDPDTGLIQQKVAFLTLISDEFIDTVVKRVEAKGGFVLFNGAATTRRRLRSPSFTETQYDITRAYDLHLHSPLAYGLGSVPLFELRRRLDFGLLYARTHLNYPSTVVANSYPFTPIELHGGWVKGEERILTAHPGRFGWDAPFKAELLIYGEDGELVTQQPVAGSGPEAVEVPLEAGQFGILRRLDR